MRVKGNGPRCNQMGVLGKTNLLSRESHHQDESDCKSMGGRHDVTGILVALLLWNICQGHRLGVRVQYKGNGKLKYKYLEDDQAQQAGTNQRGNNGCIAKLATKVKWDIMKNINRKAAKRHVM
jgi:hypothetical protein